MVEQLPKSDEYVAPAIKQATRVGMYFAAECERKDAIIERLIESSRQKRNQKARRGKGVKPPDLQGEIRRKFFTNDTVQAVRER